MRSSSSVGIFFDAERAYLLSMKSTLRGPVVEDALDVALSGEDGVERLEKFLRAGDKQKTFIALSRSRAVTVYIDLPAPAEENLEEVLSYELDRHTPYSSEQAYFDFQVIGRDRERGTIRVLVVVVPKRELDKRLDMLARAGASPVTAEISSTAIANALAYGEEGALRGLCGALVAGEKSGEFILIKDSAILYSRAFSYSSDGASHVIRDEVKRGILSRGFKAHELERLYLSTGPEDLSPEILKALEDDFSGRLAPALSGLSGPHGAVTGPHIVSFGLALRGLTEETATFDLLPRFHRSRKKRNPLYTITPLLVLVLLLGAGVLLTPVVKKTEVLQEMDMKLKAMAPQVREAEDIKRDIKHLKERLEVLESMMKKKMLVLDLLRELTALLPDDTFLTDLGFTTERIDIAGYSTSASSLIPLLENSPLLSNVEFSAPVTTRERRKGRGFFSPFVALPDDERGSVAEKGLEQFRIRAVPEEVF